MKLLFPHTQPQWVQITDVTKPAFSPLPHPCHRCSVLPHIGQIERSVPERNRSSASLFLVWGLNISIPSFETECWANQHIFQRITHSVHQVVEIVNGNVDLGSKLIFSPSVIADLCQEVHTAGVNNDFIILNVLNPIVHAIFAFSGGSYMIQASFR